MICIKIANFGPFVVDHLECNQKLIISKVVCKECLLYFAKTHKLLFEIFCLQKWSTHRYTAIHDENCMEDGERSLRSKYGRNRNYNI